MASREPYLISNPRENNRDLAVQFTDARGQRKTLALLRPGESVRVDRAVVHVSERERPLHLLVGPDGSVHPDSVRRGPQLRKS